MTVVGSSSIVLFQFRVKISQMFVNRRVAVAESKCQKKVGFCQVQLIELELDPAQAIQIGAVVRFDFHGLADVIQ